MSAVVGVVAVFGTDVVAALADAVVLALLLVGAVVVFEGVFFAVAMDGS